VLTTVNYASSSGILCMPLFLLRTEGHFLVGLESSLHRHTGILVMAPHAQVWPCSESGCHHLTKVGNNCLDRPGILLSWNLPGFGHLTDYRAHSQCCSRWGPGPKQGRGHHSYVFIESSRPRARMDWRGTFWLGLALRSLGVSSRVRLLRPIKLSLIY
jgi:hypothetical protein